MRLSGVKIFIVGFGGLLLSQVAIADVSALVAITAKDQQPTYGTISTKTPPANLTITPQAGLVTPNTQVAVSSLKNAAFQLTATLKNSDASAICEFHIDQIDEAGQALTPPQVKACVIKGVATCLMNTTPLNCDASSNWPDGGVVLTTQIDSSTEK